MVLLDPLRYLSPEASGFSILTPEVSLKNDIFINPMVIQAAYPL